MVYHTKKSIIIMKILSIIFLTIVLNSMSLFSQNIKSNSLTLNDKIQALQYYNNRNYSACVDSIESNLNNNISNNTMLIYAECLFQVKKLKKSAIIYNVLLSRKNNNSNRAARRLIDIYKLGETNIPLENLVSYISNQSLNNYFIIDLLPLLLQNNQLKYFFQLYIKNPIYLSKEKWSLMISSFSLEKFQKILKITPLSDFQKKIHLASYYLAHKQKNKAISTLDIILDEIKFIPAIQMKANIYWQYNEKENE